LRSDSPIPALAVIAFSASAPATRHSLFPFFPVPRLLLSDRRLRPATRPLPSLPSRAARRSFCSLPAPAQRPRRRPNRFARGASRDPRGGARAARPGRSVPGHVAAARPRPLLSSVRRAGRRGNARRGIGFRPPRSARRRDLV